MEKEMEHHPIVYAVSDNIISSLGFTTDENIASLMEEKTGILPVADTSLYPEPIVASLIDKKKIPAFEGAEKFHALERLMIISIQDALAKGGFDPTGKETVFIFSSTKGNIYLLSEKKEPLAKELELEEMAVRVAGFFNAANRPLVISHACISGVLTVVVAARLIKSGKYKHAVLVGGDLATEFAVSGFQSFKSVSTSPCKPYDKDRDGLSMGEGVATLILSSDKKRVKDIRPVMVAGGSSSNDANHISGPSRTGDGCWFAIKDALAEAGLSSSDVDLINAHGTATVYNDEMESKALGLASLNEVPLLGLKGYFGHALGAAGLIESIVCIEAIRRGIQFRTKGFSQQGTPVPLNVTTETRKAAINNVLKTVSGFGGCNASVIYSITSSGSDYNLNKDRQITQTCEIKDNKVAVNGKTVFDGAEYPDFATFIRSAFRAISEPYMKFSKMDDLCKLGLTAAEYLLQDVSLSQKYKPREVAIVLANRYSSLDTDIKHQEVLDIKEPYQPSPSIFVYTLANIVMGEIAIRHKLQGENLFFITEKRDKEQLQEQAEMLFSTGKAKACIIGRADYFQGKYFAELVLMEKTSNNTSL